MHHCHSLWEIQVQYIADGLKCSPDFAQKVMEQIFHDLEDTDVYIDDVGAFSKTREYHIKLIYTVLNQLQENGLFHH